MRSLVSRFAAGVIAAAGLLLPTAAAGAASAAPDAVPADVRAVFEQQALAFIAEHPAGADFASATGVADIHEIYLFSPEFLAGTVDAEPVVPSGQWIAAVLAGSSPLGTMLVWRPDGATAEIAGFTDDADLGAALAGVGDARFVRDPVTGAAYVLEGETVEPLNRPAVAELPLAASVAEFQQSHLARADLEPTASSPRASADESLWPAAVLGALGALAIAAIAAAALTVPYDRARRRAAPPAI